MRVLLIPPEHQLALEMTGVVLRRHWGDPGARWIVTKIVSRIYVKYGNPGIELEVQGTVWIPTAKRIYTGAISAWVRGAKDSGWDADSVFMGLVPQDDLSRIPSEERFAVYYFGDEFPSSCSEHERQRPLLPAMSTIGMLPD